MSSTSKGSYCNKWKRMRDKPPWEHELSEFNSPKVSYWIPGEVRDVEGELRAVSVVLRSQEVHWLHQFQFCLRWISVGNRHLFMICLSVPNPLVAKTKNTYRDFPGSPVATDPLCNAGNVGSIPVWGTKTPTCCRVPEPVLPSPYHNQSPECHNGSSHVTAKIPCAASESQWSQNEYINILKIRIESVIKPHLPPHQRVMSQVKVLKILLMQREGDILDKECPREVWCHVYYRKDAKAAMHILLELLK